MSETETTSTFSVTRRQAIGLVAGAAASVALLRGGAAEAKTLAKAATEPAAYELPELPYAKDALDGFLSAEILELHHDKHHAGYVKGLNETLEKMAEARRSGDLSGIKALERALAFHGSGHVLHTLYWNSMSPGGGGQPDGDLLAAIVGSFGSLDGFRKHFSAATKNAEASGWGILAYEPLGQRLVVLAAESHQQMGLHGTVPLLCCDVWEHAYYLRYKNDRGTYVDKWWDVVDWKQAAARLATAKRA
jgi:Fe-Mn family superoxide dismutase